MYIDPIDCNARFEMFYFLGPDFLWLYFPEPDKMSKLNVWFLDSKLTFLLYISSQMAQSEELQMFNLGESGNRKKYGQVS